MSEAALARISHIVRIEDDLVKLASLRQQFAKEKASVDAKLNTTVQQQIDLITSNMHKLDSSATSLNEITLNIDRINAVYEETVRGIPDYDLIQKVTSLNQFLTQTDNLCNDFARFRNLVDTTKSLIQHELSIISEDIQYPLEHLLTIHYNVTQARNFEDFLLLPTNRFLDDLQSIIAKIVSPIKNLVRQFDELLGEVIISLTEAVKDGNKVMAFKLIKIIEFENNEDVKVALKAKLREGQRSFSAEDADDSVDVVTTNYAHFRGQRRHYLKFFFDKLQESLEETFDKCVEHFQTDVFAVYDNLTWLEDELVFVAESLRHIFPEHWRIDQFIQGVYYNRLHTFTMDLIKTDPSAEQLLRILAYDRHYSKFVAALPGLAGDGGAKVVTKSLIGDELKQVVLEDYLKVIVAKMEEWNDNLMRQETHTFLHRDETPPDIYTYHQIIDDDDANDQPISIEIDGDVFVLPDFKTPLAMLKEQADVAADSGYGSILVGVIEHWSRCHIKRIMNYKMLINDEFENYMSVYNNDRYIELTLHRMKFFRKKTNRLELAQGLDLENMTAEELAQISKPGLVEYLTALGNTYEINTDKLQDKFLPTYKAKVHTSYQARIQEAFDDTVAPLTELNAQVIRSIIDIITNDLYPSLSTAFTKEWYDDQKQHANNEPNMAQQVLDTIIEYMQDLRGYASYDIYLCTFALLLDSFISSYIRIGYQNILNGKAKKIDPTAVKKYKLFSEAVGRDVTIFYGGLESFFTRRDLAYLLNSLRAIEFLGDLATCEDPMNFIPQMWENEILGSFYYCLVEYIRGICLCRKDMDKSQVNKLIPVLEEIQAQYHSSVSPSPQVTGTLTDFYFN